MTTINVTTGLPGSGKTTHARTLNALRFNLDDYRAMMGNSDWGGDKEAVAVEAMMKSATAAVNAGHDITLDNTHLVPRLPGRYKSLFTQPDVTFVVHDFTDVPIEECLRRDAGRSQPVGEDVIRMLWQRHQSATRNGWRLTADWLADRPTVTPYEPNAALPSAVMCDIDGTLALHQDRGPYDFDRCMSDALNLPVFEALTMYRQFGHAIVLLSGRQEEYRKHTERWLAEFNVPYDELHMRTAGDRRRDDIVKAELFDAHVRDRFNVRVSLDDRDRVVQLWRRMGLPTWQVNYGDF